MRNLVETFFSVIKRLEERNIPYMVVGSMAVMVYGEPRMTHDLDLVVDIPPQDAEKIETLFPAGEFYCPPLEFLRSEIVRQGQFNLIHNESGLKIDVIIRKQTDHAICEFGRKRKVPFWQGSEVYIASAEDIVIKKLEFFRLGGSEKHIRDIRGILAETEVDAAYLQEWVSRLGLAEQWLKVNAN